MSTLKIRITGEPDDARAAVAQLQLLYTGTEVSGPYPNRRSGGVRFYLEMQQPNSDDHAGRVLCALLDAGQPGLPHTRVAEMLADLPPVERELVRYELRQVAVHRASWWWHADYNPANLPVPALVQLAAGLLPDGTRTGKAIRALAAQLGGPQRTPSRWVQATRELEARGELVLDT